MMMKVNPSCGSNSFEYDSDPEDYQPRDETPEDFEDFMWMCDEEEFDKAEMLRLEEEEKMQVCYEAMIEDEMAQQEQLAAQIENIEAMTVLSLESPEVENSTLNPYATEFIPISISSA